MRIRTDISSKNYEPRGMGCAIDFLILHYTECDLKTALKILTDASAQARVSAHYVIDLDGTLYQLIPDDFSAWHAGVSFWRDIEGLNPWSIGIELINPGHGPEYHPFPAAQMDALAFLCARLIERYGIRPENILGHSDIAPGRKIDPGELFDWKWLSDQNIGVYPEETALKELPDAREICAALRRFGYRVSKEEGSLTAVLQAFQQHFQPDKVDGIPDAQTVGRLWNLADRYGHAS